MQKNKLDLIIKKARKIISIISFGTLVISLLIPTVYAAEDPLTVVNNLNTFIFQIARVFGTIVAGYGIIQIGISFTSHDSSQRVNGFMFAIGGVIIMFSKEILTSIAG